MAERPGFTGVPRSPGSPASNRKKKNLGPSDFTFSDILGEGSFAKVFVATSKASKKQYAAKVVDKKHVIKHKKIDAVMQEKKILSVVKHPNIVALKCAFQDSHSFYFILELVSGGELYDLIQRITVLPKPVARFFSAELITVLEYLHGKGILHRDLKPENILLTEDRHIKLTDFGTAGMISASEADTQCVGTAEYVAPEVLNGGKQTTACDIWSVGCIIFQMLAGRPPFKAASEYLTFEEVTNIRYKFPKDFPLDAKDLITRILVKDPSKRLGAKDISELKNHAFFGSIDWKNLGKMPPPTWKESSSNQMDVSQNIFPTETNEETEKEKQAQTSNQSDSKGSNSDSPTSKWERFLIKNEKVEFTGLIQKRSFSGVGFWAKTRQLILTSFPRILYVDPQQMTLRGEIPWSDNLVAEHKNRKNFVLHIKGKQYPICCLSHEANAWTEAFKKLKQKKKITADRLLK